MINYQKAIKIINKVYLNLPNEKISISDSLISNGYQAFVVGGCIRDLLLGKKPKDFDIAFAIVPFPTPAGPSIVIIIKLLFPKVIKCLKEIWE